MEKIHDLYINPFSSRYAGKEMGYIFSDNFKYRTYRKLWIELAKAEKKLGLPIKKEQISEMEKNYLEIDYERVHFYEKKLRHDVMAHIHAFGEKCPKAFPIIHLGATSCFVTDNADLITMKKGLEILQLKLLDILRKLSSFARKEANTACMSYTHFQPAQPSTVGKRACLWMQDFLFDFHECTRLIEELPFLGAKGATGTQSSFFILFQRDHKKVKELDNLLAKKFGFKKPLIISGQTYTRKLDIQILNFLSSLGASFHKFGTDLRLLAHIGEIRESFSKSQVGSSAMPHKQNPIYAERICGLARFLMSLSQNAEQTTATQWLERSLDDSSNRRLVNPQAFLAADSIVNIAYHFLKGIKVIKKTIQENLKKHIHELAMENILMHAVLKGGNRQILHQKLRDLSKKKKWNRKDITKDPAFHITEKECDKLLSISGFIGRSKEQTEEFLQTEIKPVLDRFKTKKGSFTSISV